ncbi:hypothetical protein Tco_0390851 [Tanacetum coccineum]
MQNGYSFHGLRSEDPNQHLKDFLKLVDSLNLDGENRERTRLQSISEAWTRFKDLQQKVPHHGIDLWLQVQIFYDHVNPVTRQTIDQSAGGKLRDLNAKESWALLEDLALYDNESWNDLRDFAKPVKAIALPQDVPSTSDRRLIELKTQVQRLMEAHLALTQPTQVNKSLLHVRSVVVPMILSIAWKTLNKPLLNTHPRISMKREVSGLVSNFMASQDARLSKFKADFKQQQIEMTNKIDIVLKAITDRIAGTLPSNTVKNPKLSNTPVLSAHSYPTEDPQCSTHIHSSINAIIIHPKQPEESQVNELDIGQEEEGNLGNTSSNPHPDPLASIATEHVRKLNSMLESLGLVPQSSNKKFVCSKGDDGEVMFIEIGNGYPRKGQKSKPKRQNRARERKERERKDKSKPKSQSQIKSKSTPGSGFGKSIENRTRKRKLPSGPGFLDDKLTLEELIDLTSLSFDKLELVDCYFCPVLSKGACVDQTSSEIIRDDDEPRKEGPNEGKGQRQKNRRWNTLTIS